MFHKLYHKLIIINLKCESKLNCYLCSQFICLLMEEFRIEIFYCNAFKLSMNSGVCGSIIEQTWNSERSRLKQHHHILMNTWLQSNHTPIMGMWYKIGLKCFQLEIKEEFHTPVQRTAIINYWFGNILQLYAYFWYQKQHKIKRVYMYMYYKLTHPGNRKHHLKVLVCLNLHHPLYLSKFLS